MSTAYSADPTPECAQAILQVSDGCNASTIGNIIKNNADPDPLGMSMPSSAALMSTMAACTEAAKNCYKNCSSIPSGSTLDDFLPAEPSTALRNLSTSAFHSEGESSGAVLNCRKSMIPFIKKYQAACKTDHKADFDKIMADFSRQAAARPASAAGLNLAKGNLEDLCDNGFEENTDKVYAGPGLPGSRRLSLQSPNQCVVHFIANGDQSKTGLDAIIGSATKPSGATCEKGDVCNSGDHKGKDYCTTAATPDPTKPKKPVTQTNPRDNNKVSKADYDKLKKLAEETAKKQQRQNADYNKKKTAGTGSGLNLGGGSGGTGGSGGSGGANIPGSFNSSPADSIKGATYDSPTSSVKVAAVEPAAGSTRNIIDRSTLTRGLRKAEQDRIAALGGDQNNSEAGAPAGRAPVGAGGLGGVNGNNPGQRQAASQKRRGGKKIHGKARDNLATNSFLGGSPQGGPAGQVTNYQAPNRNGRRKNNVRQANYNGTPEAPADFRGVLRNNRRVAEGPQFGGTATKGGDPLSPKKANLIRVLDQTFQFIRNEGMIDQNGDVEI